MGAGASAVFHAIIAATTDLDFKARLERQARRESDPLWRGFGDRQSTDKATRPSRQRLADSNRADTVQAPITRSA